MPILGMYDKPTNDSRERIMSGIVEIMDLLANAKEFLATAKANGWHDEIPMASQRVRTLEEVVAILRKNS